MSLRPKPAWIVRARASRSIRRAARALPVLAANRCRGGRCSMCTIARRSAASSLRASETPTELAQGGSRYTLPLFDPLINANVKGAEGGWGKRRPTSSRLRRRRAEKRRRRRGSFATRASCSIRRPVSRRRRRRASRRWKSAMRAAWRAPSLSPTRSGKTPWLRVGHRARPAHARRGPRSVCSGKGCPGFDDLRKAR